jgi:hypothetical protein
MAASARSGPAFFAAAALALIGFLPLAWLEARPRGGSEVAAIFPPWMGRERAFAAAQSAGGRVVRQGLIASILVVHGEDAGLSDRLYAAGAWAVIDPVAFGGCLAQPPADGR